MKVNRFDSLTDFLTTSRANVYRYHSEDRDFYGASLADCHALTGWDSSTAYAKLGVSAEIPAPIGRKRKRQFALAGDDWHIGRFLADEPLCGIRRRRVTSRGPQAVAISFDFGARAQISATDMVWCGIAAIRITDTLEDAGYRVSLRAINYGIPSSSGTEPVASVVALKHEAEPLCVAGLLQAVGNPAIHRYHVFNIRAMQGVNFPGGMGTTPSPDELHADVHIPHCYSQDAAEHNIRKVLESLGENR